MSSYAIIYKNNTLSLYDIDHYDIKDGFLNLYRYNINEHVRVGSIDENEVKMIMLQKEYTEEEMLAQIKDN